MHYFRLSHMRRWPWGVLSRLTGRLLLVMLLAAPLALSAAGPDSALAQSQADPEAGRDPWRGGSLEQGSAVQALHAMVATANGHATRAGVEILRGGGNAVDAAVAAQFVLNVVEPQSSGIGGGGFMLIYLADPGRVVAIDGREEAPGDASPGMFLKSDGKPQKFYPDRITGGNAVGVPGLVMALEKAIQRYGRLTLSRVMAPAIRLAEEGFAVSARLANALTKHQQRLKRFIATRKVFFTRRGTALAQGDRLVQPELAATLKLLAEKGSEPFYRGEIAKDIVRAVRETPLNPGRLTEADLAGYEAPLRRPTRIDYRGFTLYGMGPPSSGCVTTFQILQLLGASPPLKPPRAGQSPDVAARLHRYVQAVRLAYADRALFLADPDFVQIPLAGLLDPAYARRRARRHGWNRRLAQVEPGRPPGTAFLPGRDEHAEHLSTTHLSVVDEDRNMVALTSSIEQAFGSGIVVPGRGFLLNNQLTDFSAKLIDESGRLIANRVEGGKKIRRNALEASRGLGGKRPRSSMAPTLVLKNGKALMTLGSPGGGRIIQYVARVLLDVLDGRRDLQAAISAPHATHLGGITTLEPALADKQLRRRLARLGHRVRISEQNSGLHGIWINPESGMLHGAVDPRREGLAEGY